jgi:predicted nucleic acid-binding protein
VRAFADTNVLVYALVADDTRKQGIAKALLLGNTATRPSISTQVLAETYSVLVRKKQWPASDALAAVKLYAMLPVVTLSAQALIEGLTLSIQHEISSWDGMVVQAALQAGCDTLWSEDLQAGRKFGARSNALVVLNPFSAA